MTKTDYLQLLHQKTADIIRENIITYLEENSYNERIFYLLWDKYDFEQISDVKHWNTAKNIAHQIGVEKPNVKDYRTIASVFRFIYQNDESMFRHSGAQRLIKIPPLKVVKL